MKYVLEINNVEDNNLSDIAYRQNHQRYFEMSGGTVRFLPVSIPSFNCRVEADEAYRHVHPEHCPVEVIIVIQQT